jgi:dTDP-4-dehydrorhamnose reductase
MRILVAGARGQLARALVEAARRRSNCRLVALGRPQLDLAVAASVIRALDDVQPDIVVNAAAYTAVDKAESEADGALAINRDGACVLAAAAGSCGRPIVHISTDYVFDGAKPEPYLETDAANPLGAYGRSKHEGELAVTAANPHHLILRTAWLYAPYGQNFLRTILRLAGERSRLGVVADQKGNPTYAPHLAAAILDIAAQLMSGKPADTWGIYHAAAGGGTTWAAFADAIVRAGARLGAPQVQVEPITTRECARPARRPANSRLDCSKLERTFGIRLPPWQQGVEECIDELARAEAALLA